MLDTPKINALKIDMHFRIFSTLSVTESSYVLHDHVEHAVLCPGPVTLL